MPACASKAKSKLIHSSQGQAGAQPFPERWAPSWVAITWKDKLFYSPFHPSPQFFLLSIRSCDLGYLFDHWGQLLPLCPLPVCLHFQLVCWWSSLRRLWVCVSVTQQQLKDACVINPVFTVNAKHSAIQAAVRKARFIPAMHPCKSGPCWIAFAC